MMRMVCLLSLAVLLLFPVSAMAYLDPGTGSYALQVLGAALFAGLFALKAFWGRVRAFMSRFLSKKGSGES